MTSPHPPKARGPIASTNGALARIDWREVETRPCPVASALDVFGDRWSMLIIRDVMNGVHRFDDLVERLGVSRATLTDRLRRLTTAEILDIADYHDTRGRLRSEYRLTEHGWGLRLVLVALREWGDKHAIGAGNEPLRLVDRSTGHAVHLELVDDVTGAIVDGHHVQHVPGPGFKRRELGPRASVDDQAHAPGTTRRSQRGKRANPR